LDDEARCAAHTDDLVRVDALGGVETEHLLDLLDDGRRAGHAAHQDHVVDLVEAGILEGRLAGLDGAVHEGLDEFVELLLGEGVGEVLVAGDEGQVDLVVGHVIERLLGLLGALPQPLDGEHVLGQIDALLLLELVHQVLEHGLIEVLTAEEGVAVGGNDLAHAVADLEDGDIKGSATQIEHGQALTLLGVLLAETVRERGRGGLVDDTEHIKTGDGTGILGRLTLGVVEVTVSLKNGKLLGWDLQR
jgi:hypothetical protein